MSDRRAFFLCSASRGTHRFGAFADVFGRGRDSRVEEARQAIRSERLGSNRAGRVVDAAASPRRSEATLLSPQSPLISFKRHKAAPTPSTDDSVAQETRTPRQSPVL